MGQSKLETEYPLETVYGVNAFLADFHHIQAAAYDKGDFDAVNLIVDFQTVSRKVEPTPRQKEALHYVFDLDLTQREAGERMGISQQAVQQLISVYVEKVAKQYASDLRLVERRGAIQ